VTEFDAAVLWAKVRAAGPQRVAPGGAAPAGMRRLVEADAQAVWLLPNLPDGARPTVLDELGLAGMSIEQPNDTARVLAGCLRCCWADLNANSNPIQTRGHVSTVGSKRRSGTLYRSNCGTLRIAGSVISTITISVRNWMVAASK
jgi:hypothetical protein